MVDVTLIFPQARVSINTTFALGCLSLMCEQRQLDCKEPIMSETMNVYNSWLSCLR
jgi:hypothetical protein